jgi:hypothetical protein
MFHAVAKVVATFLQTCAGMLAHLWMNEQLRTEVVNTSTVAFTEVCLFACSATFLLQRVVLALKSGKFN